ncbi:MAG: hypothetical protein COV41_02765 [Candidatus Brennerbacteria bacterium CG11_big_fil_rev_8_21_14_0_20_43_10]|uniref:Uncharacterized protein n=3 Tax=Candidatus Brenneribacteriota TaxID=1817902 RepID=A0A2M8C1R0_9BACT|nr:MAG: hypothetical protein AUJ43_00640 [Parcubacteria group bacterium CG1_02_44_31]PIP50618.1 MAG: hypothetical protein COX12_00225 [Candidatus Brennerbacteria bacterium CG23_combo_of_CG06-09_8_20_14_all_44_41]PIR25445.1 MAG: hypothetical protein COV41_02765 [Candidatus Brennerbacteria bacterium CG11_big_fil_rev_8_21_14_0_20_43_10]PIX28910.1 MAG: hypothetical protein COZ64_01580 [Candidatus Brennerbacteria bacterium CG_4_8_14_3_um_filter_43_14]PJB49994.1 MAG: hypothetical protein CO102_02285 
METWQMDLLEHLQDEMLQDDPVYKRLRYVIFFSWSNGRGKPKWKKPRIVELLYLVKEGTAFCVKNLEIKRRRKNDSTPPADMLAQEVLTDVLWPDRSPDLMLKRARRNKHGWKFGF